MIELDKVYDTIYVTGDSTFNADGEHILHAKIDVVSVGIAPKDIGPNDLVIESFKGLKDIIIGDMS